MEYVAGRSLKTIVREEGPLDPARAIDLVIQILRGARFAHRRGVIHRDLKPHNVILDEEGRARVTDFGIARAGASDMTMTGSIMGTAQYLSPEQAQGFSVSAASDLYSVGVILYELLTGVVPFEGETAVAIAFKQVSAQPRAPSELNPALAPSLDAVVLRVLAKDPASRYADADELIAALQHERETLPAYAPAAATNVVQPHPVPPPHRPGAGALLLAPVGPPAEELDPLAPEDGRRSRALLWALAALAVAAAIALFLLLSQAHQRVVVPSVTGQSEQTAGARLRAAGLNPVPSLASSTTVATGLVISQSPRAGSKVERGSRATFVVSGGPASKALPNVVGLSAASATGKLRQAGFKPTVKKQASTTVAAGRVIGSEPAAFTVTQVGSPVAVLVSSGPAPVSVPDLVGQSLTAAEAALVNAGLTLGTVTQHESSTQAAGTVLSQAPPTGTSVRTGSKVGLTVAQAPKEAAVPEVVGQSEALAAAALGQAGFKPKTVPAPTTSSEQAGMVLKQTPAGGAQARKGATVTITVGVLGPQTTPTTTTPAPPPTTPTPPAATPGAG
jgi:serine/threonine-protein kinase